MEQTALVALVNRLRSATSESETVEFKVNWHRPHDIGEYVSALANSAVLEGHDRAWMVWGIDDATHEVVGTTFNPATAKGEGNQSLEMWLTQLVRPRPDFTFHVGEHPGGRIVLMEIRVPRTAPLAFSGKRYIRVGSHTTKLNDHPDKERRIWAALERADDWSGGIVTSAGVDDLDPEAVEAARQRFTEYLQRNETDPQRKKRLAAQVRAWDVQTMLNKAHVTKQGRITRAALLLLGKDEAAHMLAPADIKISWVLRDAKNATQSSQHFGLPLLLASQRVFDRIRNVTVEHLPDGSLFPTAVTRYDPWVIREALHNCIAHRDYRLGGKINVVEHPEKLVFSNLGRFIPPSIEWMLDQQSPPEYYRNPWLVGGMVRLRMIDQVGSGIRRMFETQRERFFPLPSYSLEDDGNGRPRVAVTVMGAILDVNYTRMLMKRSDLHLRDVLLLDRVQKREPLQPAQVRALRAEKLIEGRSPNLYVSARVAAWTGDRARYIHNRGLGDDYYRRLIVDYLQKYGHATRKDINDLLLPKLPDVLNAEQKANKIRNLMQAMRKVGKIHREGTKAAATWHLGGGQG